MIYEGRFVPTIREFVGAGKVCRRPRTALLVPFVIFFRWPAQETSASWPIRNILRISPPLPEEYPVRGSRETLGSLFRRNENWLLIPQLVRRRGRGKVCPCIPSGVGWWASIKTYFAGGPSDVNNLALVSFVIIAVTSIWRKKFRARGRGG